MPKTCPVCGGPVIREEGEAVSRCIGIECKARNLRNIIHFASKEGMNIEGLGEKIVEQLYSSSFEVTIAGHVSAVDAGNKAVEEETKRAKEAGQDISTAEFKKHLQTVRQDAEEATRRYLRTELRNDVLTKSHLAHKLQSLINLRAQHNTISDFFQFLTDKFNISPKRPDAKLIVDSVDKQIQSAKEQLAEMDEDFDAGLPDGAILDYIKNMQLVRSNSDEIERFEIANAM